MIAVTVEPDNAPPRVRVDTTGEQVWRMQGGSLVEVRGTVSGGVIYDYECPQETPVRYTTGPETSGLVELPACGDWLVHLADPDLSQQVTLREHPEWTRPAIRDVVDIPASSATGEGRTVAVSFGRGSRRGDVSFNTYTREGEVALDALLSDGTILFLSTHLEVGFGPAYLTLGDVSWRRVATNLNEGRVASVSYVEVDRPAVIVGTSLTWAQLGPTWASLAPSWDALERG